ncbi:hypothetical protein IT568_03940 [bacterium]|nr:hypothetical protein [bacterium]
MSSGNLLRCAVFTTSLGLVSSAFASQTGEFPAPVKVGDLINQYENATTLAQKKNIQAKMIKQLGQAAKKVAVSGKNPAQINQGTDTCAGATNISITNGTTGLPINQSGTTVGYANDYNPTGSALDGPDVVYQLDVNIAPATVNISATPSALFDIGFIIIGPTTSGAADCTNPSFINQVVDTNGPGVADGISNKTLAVGTYFIVVDGYNLSDGTYTLDITQYVAPSCSLTLTTTAPTPPNVIQYDTGSALYYNSSNQYGSMKFTPTGDFALSDVRFQGYNPNGILTNGFVNLWITGDNAGVPDASNILYSNCFDYTVGTTSFIYLPIPSGAVNWTFGNSYHVVLGPLSTGGTGPYFLMDNNNDYNRGYISGTPFVPGTAWLPGANDNEVIIRVGGTTTAVPFSDLASSATFNTTNDFFNCSLSPITPQARISSLGNQAVTSFSVLFEVKDASNVTIYTNTVAGGPIDAAGGTTDVIDVTASSSWTPPSLGDYVIYSTVSFTGAVDFDPTNNTSALEHHAITITNVASTTLSYDDGVVDGSVIWTINSGRLVGFEPCVYPVKVDAARTTASVGGSVKILVFGDNGSGGPNVTTPLFSTIATVAIGDNTIPVTGVTISSGRFFIGWVSQNGTVTLSYDSSSPLASNNSQMGPVGYSLSDASGVYTATVDPGNDYILRADVRLPVSDDVSCNSVSSTASTIPGNTNTVSATIANVGANSQNSFSVGLTIWDAGSNVVFTNTKMTGTIAAGGTEVVIFDPYTLALAPQTYTYTVTTQLAGDLNATNDAASGTFKGEYFISFGSGTTSAASMRPIYRSSASSSFDYSRTSNLYTATDLAGLPAGATITDIQFYKDNNGATVSNGATLNLWMRNSTVTNYTANSTWDAVVAGATSVYSSTTQGIPSTLGWLSFGSITPFTYNGSSLEIISDWNISGITGNPTTGGFNWRYDAYAGTTTDSKGLSYASSAAPTGTSAMTTNNSNSHLRVPHLKIVYIPAPTPVTVNVQNSGNDATLTWTASPVATSYKIYRGSTPDFVADGTTLQTTVTGTSWTDVGVSSLGTTYYYKVTANN